MLSKGFLSRIPPIVSRTFDDWVEARRSALRSDLLRIASQAWDEYRSDQRWLRALDAAEALYCLDPTDSAAVAKIIEGLVRAARFSSADAAYSLYVDSLPPGAEPDPRVAELAARVGSLSASKLMVPSRFADGHRTGDGPLFGRRHELQHLRSILVALEEGKRRNTLIRGLPGSGKSRLIEEMRKEAILKGHRWIFLKGAEADREYAFATVLHGLGPFGLEERLEKIGLVPGVPDLTTLGFFREYLRELAGERPTVLAVDDLQWVDAASVAMLRMLLARPRQAVEVVVVCTLTRGMAVADETKAFLQDDTCGTRLDLAPLSDRAATELVSFHGGSWVSPSKARLLGSLACNHPVHLLALARAQAEGKLAIPKHPLEPLDLPSTLRPHFGRILREIDGQGLATAAALAVCGRPVPMGVLHRLAGQGASVTAGHLSRLDDLGQIRVEQGLVRLSHALFRSAVLVEIGPARRAFLHGRLADLLQSDGTGASDDLAFHYAHAGEHDKAVSAARDAVEEAEKAEDTDRVLANLGVVQQIGRTEDERVRGAQKASVTLVRLGLLEKALPFLEEAASGLRSAGSTKEALDFETVRCEALMASGRTGPALVSERLAAIGDEAAALGCADVLASVSATQLRAAVRAGTLPSRESLERLRKLSGRRAGRPRLIALRGLALLAAHGEPREALKAGLQAVRLTCGTSDDERLLALLAVLSPLRMLGMTRSRTARRLLTEALELANATNNTLVRSSVLLELGVAALGEGRHHQARTHLHNALRASDRTELAELRFRCELTLGDLLLELNDVPGARRAFHLARSWLNDQSSPDAHFAAKSGLGLCDIAVGAFSAALARHSGRLESGMAFPEVHAYLSVAYRAHVFASRQRLSEAVHYVIRTCDLVEGRCLPCWIRLRRLEASLALRHRLDVDLERLGDAYATAERIGFKRRAAELEAVLERARSRPRN